MKEYYVYILANKRNGTIYIGMTNDLERRIKEHKLKEVKGFTEKYNLDKLVYFETFSNNSDAFIRERQLKKWNRKWKLRLIEENNLEWKNLAEDWD